MDEPYHRSSYSDAYSTSRPLQQRYRPVGKTPPHQTTYGQPSNSSYLTGTNFGILVAILVIYLFQRKDGFGRVLAARRERGLLNATMDCLLEIQDYVVSYVQMAVELCRNLRLHYLGNLLEDWFASDMNIHATQNSSVHTPRGRRRSTAAPVASRMETGRMPELEETDADKLKAASGIATIINGPLEPTFLKDEDYPPQWLVFDPVLGVVSKVEADKHREEERKKQHADQEPQRQSAQSAKPVSPRRLPPQIEQRKQQSPANYQSNSNPPCPIRNQPNVIPNASAAMMAPQTIAANG